MQRGIEVGLGELTRGVVDEGVRGGIEVGLGKLTRGVGDAGVRG